MGDFRIVGFVAALALTLTACTSAPSEATSTGSPGGGTPDKEPSTSGAPMGSASRLPVTFDVADKWVAKQVTDADKGGALTNQGGFTMACEIDAKPAGHLGFLRVWTSTSTTKPRAALDAFLAADRNITVPEFTEPKIAGTAAAEVTYVRDNPTAEIKKRERALVLPTAKGAVLLHLGGVDDEEHTAMLPAYELAKQSMQIRQQ